MRAVMLLVLWIAQIGASNPANSTGSEAENKNRQVEPATLLKSRNQRKSANYFRIDDPGRGTKEIGRWTHKD